MTCRRISPLAFFAVVCLSLCANVFSQSRTRAGSVTVDSVEISSDKGLKVVCKISGIDASKLNLNSKINYVRVLKDGTLTQVKPITATSNTASELVFVIDETSRDSKAAEFTISLIDDTGALRARTIAQRVNLDHQEKAITSESQIQQQKATIEDLQKSLRTSTDNEEAYRKRIADFVNNYQATEFTPTVVFRTDERLVVSARLKGNGKIRGVIECTSAGCAQPAIKTLTSEFGSEVVLPFRGLSGNQSYKIVLGIVDATDSSKVIGERTIDGNDGKTLGPENTVELTSYKLDIKPNNLLHGIVKSSRTGFYTLRLEEKKGEGFFDANITIGKPPEIDQGVLKGQDLLPTPSDTEIVLEKAKPNTEYRAHIKVWNKYGIPTANEYVTAPFKFAPVSFGFSKTEAAQITLNPLGAKFSWKATAKPDSAEAKLILPGKTVISDRSPTYTTINGEQIIIKLSANEVGEILARTNLPITGPTNTNNPVAVAAPKPTIVLEMTKNDVKVEMRLEVSLELPSVADVEQKYGANPSGSDKEAKRALLRVIEAASKPTEDRKIKWDEVLKAGIGFALKAVPVVGSFIPPLP